MVRTNHFYFSTLVFSLELNLQRGRVNLHVVGDTKWRFGTKGCYLHQGNVKYTKDLLKLSACGILQEIVDISGDGDEICQGFIKIKRTNTWHFGRNSCYLLVMVVRRGMGS